MIPEARAGWSYDVPMPERVRITDVSPRDGLQNEPGVIPTADKVRLVELLCARVIMVAKFGRPNNLEAAMRQQRKVAPLVTM